MKGWDEYDGEDELGGGGVDVMALMGEPMSC